MKTKRNQSLIAVTQFLFMGETLTTGTFYFHQKKSLGGYLFTAFAVMLLAETPKIIKRYREGKLNEFASNRTKGDFSH